MQFLKVLVFLALVSAVQCYYTYYILPNNGYNTNSYSNGYDAYSNGYSNNNNNGQTTYYYYDPSSSNSYDYNSNGYSNGYSNPTTTYYYYPNNDNNGYSNGGYTTYYLTYGRK